MCCCQHPLKHLDLISMDPEKGKAEEDEDERINQKYFLEGTNGVVIGNKTVLFLLKLGISSVVVGMPMPSRRLLLPIG